MPRRHSAARRSTHLRRSLQWLVTLARANSGSRQRQSHLVIGHFDPESRDRLGCRPGLAFARADVELRPVPGALHRPADQDSVRERATLVSAAIVKGDIALLRPRQDNSPVADAHKLHLIDFKLALPGYRDR